MGAGASIVPSEPKIRRVAYIKLFNAAREKGLTIRGFCEQTFKETDGNNDGYLTKNEFIEAAMGSGFSPANGASVEALFEALLEKDPTTDCELSQLSVQSFVRFLLQTRALKLPPQSRGAPPAIAIQLIPGNDKEPSSPHIGTDNFPPRRRRPSVVGDVRSSREIAVTEQVHDPAKHVPKAKTRRRGSITKKRPSVVSVMNADGREEVKQVGDLGNISYSAGPEIQNTDFNKILGVSRVQNLRRCSLLGLGMFGTVKLVQDAQTGTPYALKTLSKAKIVDNKQENNVLNEKTIMENLSHPFMVKLITTAQDKNSLYMVLDLVQGGELFHLLHGKGGSSDRTLPVPQACFYAACVVLVYEHMHAKNWLYRDLKPENLLIDKSGYIKVVDFGFAKQLATEDEKTFTFLGTPEYMAPELIRRRGYGKGVDYWALGCLIYEMLTSTVPFSPVCDGSDEEYQKQLYQVIASGRPVMFPDGFAEDFRPHCDSQEEVAAGMIQRMETKGLVNCLLADQINMRLGCRPGKLSAGGIAELKNHGFFEHINWDNMLAREVKAPWMPALEDDLDMRHFDEYDPSEEAPHEEFSGENAPFATF